MVSLGLYNSLKVIKRVDFGLFLDGEELGEILLPKKYTDKNTVKGDTLEVFLYNDSEDRIVATTLKPKAVVGECAYLRVVDTNRIGAFFDWGLPKDLLVPFNEQQKPMQKGYSYTVFLFVDEDTQRIAASSRLEDHLATDIDIFEPRQAVDLQIYGKSDLGFKAVINGTHLGQLYENETFKKLHYGEIVKGYIKQLRTDGKSHVLQGENVDHIDTFNNDTKNRIGIPSPTTSPFSLPYSPAPLERVTRLSFSVLLKC